MMSRSSALAIAELYRELFAPTHFYHGTKLHKEELHDFLFERDYPAWFYAKPEFLFSPREVQLWIMHLQTGQTQYGVTQDMEEEERLRLGHELLRRLAEDILNTFFDDTGGKLDRDTEARFGQRFVRLLRCLTFDGYVYQDRRLRPPEGDVLDTKEAAGVLESLFTDLALAEKQVTLQCLKKSEEFWHERKWDECINNARKFLEATMRQVAAAHHLRAKGGPLEGKIYSKAEMVRQYLRHEGLLEQKEEDAIRVVYGLLSNTGSHPYIAQSDQARLLRQAALIFSQFIMLRYQGYLKAKP